VSRVEIQLAAKGYALGVFIEGAFDSTSISSIKDSMIRHKIPGTFMD